MEEEIRGVRKEKRVEMVQKRIKDLQDAIKVLEAIANNPDVGEKKILDELGVDFAIYRRVVYDLDWSSKLSPSTRKDIQEKRRHAFPTACWQEALWLELVGGVIGNLQCAPTDTADTIDEMISTLSEREQRVIRLRFEELMSLDEVGQELNVTSGRVRQIEAKALRKLRWRYDHLKMGIGQYGTLVGMQKRLEDDMEVKIKYEVIQMLNDTFTDMRSLISTAYKIVEDNEQAERLRDIRAGGDIAIEDMDLSIRTYNCVRRAGFSSLADFRNGVRASEIMGIRNLGWSSYNELTTKLREYGVNIIDDIHD